MTSMHRISTAVFVAVITSATLTAAALAQSTTRRSFNGTVTWAHSDNGEGYEVKARGKIVFRDDDRGVASISDDGYLKIRVREDGDRLYLEVRPDGRGNLRYLFEVNGRERDYDARARAEMEDIFLQVIRESGIDANRRVARLLKEGGKKAVFDEIDRIQSSGSTRLYVLELVEQARMDENDLLRLADIAENGVHSSGSRTQIMIDSVELFFSHDETVDAYFDVVSTIPSSGDRMRALLAALEQSPDRVGYLRLIEVATDLPSSGDKTRVLASAVGDFSDDSAIRKAFFEAVNTIPSSGDRSRLLMLLLTEYELDEATVEAAFGAARGLPSSGDKSRVLVAAAPYYTGSMRHREMFFDAVDTIPSSGDRSRVLLKLLDRKNVDDATLMAVLESVRGIPSSSDAGRVLRAAVKFVETDAQVDAYLKAADSIASQGERGRALTALIKKG